ncbi:MAG: CdaR family protein [Chthonomonadales bacterium]
MLKPLREDLGLKLISIVASVVLWFYVTADRYPSTTVTRTVAAEVVKVGLAPVDIVVRLRSDPVSVDITGPKGVVETINDGDVKAEVDLRSARAGTNQIKISRYKLPPNSTDVEAKGRQYVMAEILPRAKKSFPIQPQINQLGSTMSKYGTPKLSSEWASAVGAQDDIKRIAKLVAIVDANGGAVSLDTPIRPIDRDGLEISGVEVQPSSIHVDLTAPEAPSSRVLPVNIPHKITTAPNFMIYEIQVEPAQISVMGRMAVVSQMANVTTEEVSGAGLQADLDRVVKIVLPAGVTTVDGRKTVHVRFRVKEVSAASPTTTD